MASLVFFAPGIPATKGSTRSFVNKKTGAVATTADCKRLKDWHATVALAAQEAGAKLVSGAVSIEVVFRLPRPKGHYGTGRNAGQLKDSAPHLHTTKPDLDKLQRAIGDALKGIAYVEDSRVVEWKAYKRYAEREEMTGAWIEVQVCA
jgi:Holliday junction resolvase RusA-like endonuclease